MGYPGSVCEVDQTIIPKVRIGFRIKITLTLLLLSFVSQGKGSVSNQGIQAKEYHDQPVDERKAEKSLNSTKGRKYKAGKRILPG